MMARLSDCASGYVMSTGPKENGNCTPTIDELFDQEFKYKISYTDNINLVSEYMQLGTLQIATHYQ